jgi:hypothetical protein
MKAIVKISVILISLVLGFASCGDENDGDTRLVAVGSLLEPADAKDVVLEATGSIYFEWEPCKDVGMVLYQVGFDKADGDFSNPVYLMYSDNNGGKPSASITYKQINKIAGMAGIPIAQAGTLKWAVFSIKGINSVQSAQVRTINLTRLAGFEEVPVDIFVTGEGSEGGNDLSKAQQMKATAIGEFEVYTKLEAGKGYYFTSAKIEGGRNFYIQDGVLGESGETVTTMTVEKTSVYRINLDFNLGASSYTEVVSFWLYFCPTFEKPKIGGSELFELPYRGYGIFKAENQPITFFQESWGGDERYKFHMYVVKGEEKVLETWGTKNDTDGRPTTPTDPPLYFFMEYIPNRPAVADWDSQWYNPRDDANYDAGDGDYFQWNKKWKFHGDMDGAIVNVTAFFQLGDYTHAVEKVGNQ